jgi:signal transduction histidine kinase
MRERLVRLGGHVNVESAPGKGTRVDCFCPVQKKKGEDL